MSSEKINFILAIIAACLLLTTLALGYCLILSEKILNWYIRKYNSEPRVIYPPNRSRLHRWIISFLIRPEKVKQIPDYIRTLGPNLSESLTLFKSYTHGS